MTMRFSILGSSSSGNSSLLITEQCKVLIDVGFSCKRLCEMLEARSVKPEEIDAVFITHEHGDHATGLSTFCKRFKPKVYANPMTARALMPKLNSKPEWALFNTGSSFQHRDLAVESFSIPHDAHDPVGYKFSSGRGDLFSPFRSLAWLTDLGFAPRHVAERIRDVDTLVIESNHDLDLLQNDEKRPWSVKQRIGGRHGHLSNKAAAELLASIVEPRWSRVYLAHLSKDCNTPKAIDDAFAALRSISPFPIDTILAGAGSDLVEV